MPFLSFCLSLYVGSAMSSADKRKRQGKGLSTMILSSMLSGAVRTMTTQGHVQYLTSTLRGEKGVYPNRREVVCIGERV